jgi:hypothetical protein
VGQYGVVDGVARDSRCENCMVHCGYDPSGALGTNYQRGDHWKNFKYNFSPRPPRFPDGASVNAFNGYSVGKGHLAEANAVLRPVITGAATGCGGDTTQRDDLLPSSVRTKAGTWDGSNPAVRTLFLNPPFI